MEFFDKLFKNKKPVDFPPKPKWRPNLEIDIELIYNKAIYYTDNKFQFAIFQYGTIVFFPTRVDDIEKSAKYSLNKIYYSHPDFKPSKMDDGNYIIQYSQPSFTIVFENEIKNSWDYIDKNHQDGICKDEVLISAQGQRNVFDSIGKISLFGRAKMFMDAQVPQVVRIFEPTL